MLCVSVAAAQIPTNGLIAYYPFSGNANDQSGNGNNGTVNGATLTTDRFGNASSAYAFDGSNNNITINSLSAIYGTGARSLSLWMKSDTTHIREDLFSIGGCSQATMFSLIYDDEHPIGTPIVNGLKFGGYADDIQTANNVVTRNVWNHVVVVYDGNVNIKIYINDSLTIGGDIGLALHISSSSIRIGKGLDCDGGSAFQGEIDDIRIYNRTLSSSEINSLYEEGGWTNLNTGLVAYYPFNGNANDESWNGNDGTINGATLTTDRFGNLNSAYQFDGVNNNVTINTLTAMYGTGSRSLSLWMRPGSTHSRQDLFSIGGCSTATMFNLIYDDENPIGPPPNVNGLKFGGYYDDLQTAENIVTRNVWNHIVVVYDGSENIKIYLNDTLSVGGNISSPLNVSSTSIRIGKGLDCDGGLAFDGEIDDIRIYNRILSTAEITSLFNEGGWALPVELTSFIGKSNQGNVQLKWNTATEVNNSGFEIDRSGSSSAWMNAGFVQGSGTSNAPKEYSFVDNNVPVGKYSYRLKQIDRDGLFKFSQTIEVDVNCGSDSVLHRPKLS